MKLTLSLAIVFTLIGCGRGFQSYSPQMSDFQFDRSVIESELEPSPSQIGDLKQDSQPPVSPTATPRPDQADQVLEPQNPVASTPLPSTTPESKVKPAPQKKQSQGSFTDLERVDFRDRVLPKIVQASDLSASATLKPTIYYLVSNDVTLYRYCKSNEIKSFRAKIGLELMPGIKEIKVCSKFFYKVQMEGSGLLKLKDGRNLLINYVGVQLALPRFKIVDRNVCPYGLGRSNRCLQPFISIAADPSRYKVGDVIYVPAVADAKIRLPDGDTHLGFFVVTDTGAAIRGPGRFDFFTGQLTAKDSSNPLAKIGLQSKANRDRLQYHRIQSGSATEKMVHEYYKGRQIIPY